LLSRLLRRQWLAVAAVVECTAAVWEEVASMAAAWVVASEALPSAVDFAALRLTPVALTAADILPDMEEDDLPEAVVGTGTVEI
jgi:hypothetical protein